MESSNVLQVTYLTVMNTDQFQITVPWSRWFSNIKVKNEEKEQLEIVVIDDDNKKTNYSNQSLVVNPSSSVNNLKSILKTKSNSSSKKLGLKLSMKKNEEPKYLGSYLLKQAHKSISYSDDPKRCSILLYVRWNHLKVFSWKNQIWNMNEGQYKGGRLEPFHFKNKIHKGNCNTRFPR